MKAKRRRHDPEFKARVALEALKGIKTIQEIAKEYEIHLPNADPRHTQEWLPCSPRPLQHQRKLQLHGPWLAAP